MERLLSAREVGEQLGVTRGTVYNLVNRGQLHRVRISARCVRYRESEVAALITDSTQKG